MTDMESKYCMTLKAIGAIEQRIIFYLERADDYFCRDGEGSASGLLFQHKAVALQEALNLLEGGE